MSVPGIVEDALGDDDVAARISLSGEDEVFVTADRTLVYRAGGVLTDESVEEYPNGADRLSVSEGRRKAKIEFEYPVDDPRTLSIPKNRIEETIQPVLASVLRKREVTDADESFVHAFRFSELSMVITSERIIKHVGPALWDDDYETFHFEDVTDLTYEEGSVATGIVLTVEGRKERIKAPKDRVPEIREFLESALFNYHDIDSIEELPDEETEQAASGASEADTADSDSVTSFEDEGIDPLDAGPGAESRDPLATPGDGGDGDAQAVAESGGGAESATEGDADEAAADNGTSDSAEGGEVASTPFTQEFEPAESDLDEKVGDELEALREAVERQNELLTKQQHTLERLIEQLRNG